MSDEWSDTVVLGVVALLREKLPARLAEIEDERADGIELEAPREYWACDKQMVQSTPSVEVWCPDSTRVTQDTPFRYRHRVAVVLTVAGTDEERLDAQLRRSLMAVLQVLDGQLVAGADLIAGTATYLLSAEGDAERPFARSGALELTAQTITDFAED